MAFPRASGILLHPSSLASRGGIGDLGPAAYEFIDFLAAARQGVWQVLPLSPLGLGNSPYSSLSAFAGTALLVSLERLAERGWIGWDRLETLPGNSGPVDFEAVRARKLPLVFEAAGNFFRKAQGTARARFDAFCAENKWWLDDFVLFNTLRGRYKKDSWHSWPKRLKRREPSALDKERRDNYDELVIGNVAQFFFFEQWRALRRYCAEHSIRIAGDIAIFVSYDSADVWTNPDLFHLDDNLEPTVVSGVPPDYFSTTGQRWGNPIYRWDVMRDHGYDWWIKRLRWMASEVDYIRLDHFRGFEQYWEIPASEPTAVRGHWAEGPKDDFFRKVREEIPEFPFFVEDLGIITPQVNALREAFGLPRMAVLQFGFGDAGSRIYLPHRCAADTVIYTGTHDTDTVKGWWAQLSEYERRNAETYLGAATDGIHWSLVRAAMTSPACLAVAPMQDVLGLGSEARMNIPSQPEGNWTWRLAPGSLTSDLSGRLAHLVEVTDREPKPIANGAAEEFVA
jgi:4-alpha-glucanotransferase